MHCNVIAFLDNEPLDAVLRLYNTASRQKELLVPLHAHCVRLYTCGPTIYHFAHIGNFRTYVFEDLLRRTIKFFGFDVMQVMNLTDVDDKTIKGAIAQGVSLEAYTRPYKEAFFQDLHTLRIEPAERYPAATDYIPDMIHMIEILLEKGIAYRGGDGSIYFAIRQFPRYGSLSHLHLDELQTGASERIANDEYEKDHAADFALWKAYDPARDGQIYWESPFGPGRPGWHLECSAMARKILGDTLDIHAGGVDNLFPHHENEIAQSEACSGVPFVNIWMHAEHLVVDHKKMSKSLGNFYTLRDLLDRGYSGLQVRYLLLHTHYKTQLNFTFQGLESAKAALQRLHDFMTRLRELRAPEEGKGKVEPLCRHTLRLFAAALADDLNIAAALGALFDFVREVNGLCDTGEVSEREAIRALQLMERLDTVLGVLHGDDNDPIPAELQEALNRRLEARRQKNWKEADILRDWIEHRGYLIEDTPNGARLKKAPTPHS